MKKITDELLEHQTPVDHPGIVARVFKLKLYALLQDLYRGCSICRIPVWRFGEGVQEYRLLV